MRAVLPSCGCPPRGRVQGGRGLWLPAPPCQVRRPLLASRWPGGLRGRWAWGRWAGGSCGFACGQQGPVRRRGLIPGQVRLCSERGRLPRSDSSRAPRHRPSITQTPPRAPKVARWPGASSWPRDRVKVKGTQRTPPARFLTAQAPGKPHGTVTWAAPVQMKIPRALP